MHIIKQYVEKEERDEHVNQQRMVTILSLLVIETLAQLQKYTIMTLKGVIDELQKKIANFIKDRNANKKRSVAAWTFRDIDYTKLKEWGLNRDEERVLADLRNMFSRIFVQVALLAIKSEKFKESAANLQAHEIPKVIEDNDYKLLVDDVFQALEAREKNQIDLLQRKQSPPRN
eukprot:UN07314